jgi:hypothetical protein
MKINLKGMAAPAVAAILSFAALETNAADVRYEFDTITGFELLPYVSPTDQTYITGIPRNSTTPITVHLNVNLSTESPAISRCLPLLLTMMEKPGRYYLSVTIWDYGLELRGCGLLLRN